MVEQFAFRVELNSYIKLFDLTLINKYLHFDAKPST